VRLKASPWEEFKTDDFTEDADCLPDGRDFNPAGYRAALKRLEERGLLLKRAREREGTP
jgi:hypothetical protein